MLDVSNDLAALRRNVGRSWLIAEPEPEADVAAPTSLHDAVRPRSWDDYVGQERTTRLLRVAIAGAQAGGRRLGHVFLYGPSGAGKTTLARLIAGELGAQYAECTKQATAAELARVLWDAGIGTGPGVLLLDEVHTWTKRYQDGLLNLADEGWLDVGFDRFHFPMLTIIAATTERHEMRPALLQRFSLKPDFEPYTIGELTEIVAGMGDRLGMDLDSETAEALAAAAAGVPRQARHLVEMARNIRDAGMEPTAADVLELTGIEPDGLTGDHLRYLSILAAGNGHAGIDTLETRLDMHPKDLRRLERLLADRGLVGRDTRGRYITAGGRTRLRQTPEGAAC